MHRSTTPDRRSSSFPKRSGNTQLEPNRDGGVVSRSLACESKLGFLDVGRGNG